MKFLWFSLLLGFSIIAFTQAKLPTDLEKCHFGAVKCIAQSMQYVLRNYPKGNDEMGLNAVNAIHLTNVSLMEPNPGTPMQMNVFYKDFVITNLETATVNRVVGFNKDIDNSKFDVYVTVPRVRALGKYKASGKMLLLPINGGGDSTIDLIDLKIVVNVKVKKESRDGKEYAKVVLAKTTFEPKSIKFSMENLLNGNEEMSKAVNDLLNENWKDLWGEIKPNIQADVSDALFKLLSDVLNATPYNELFLPD